MSFDQENLFLTSANKRAKRPLGNWDEANLDEDKSAFIAAVQLLIWYGEVGNKVCVQGMSSKRIALLKELFPNHQFSKSVKKADLLVVSTLISSYQQIKDEVYEELGIGVMPSSLLTEQADKMIEERMKQNSEDRMEKQRLIVNKVKPKAMILNFSLRENVDFYKGIPLWGLYTTDLWLLCNTTKTDRWLFDELDSYLYHHNAVERSQNYGNPINSDGPEYEFDETAEMYTLALYHSLSNSKEDLQTFYNRIK